MPIPHDECPLRVAKVRSLLLLMQHKFFRHPNASKCSAANQPQREKFSLAAFSSLGRLQSRRDWAHRPRSSIPPWYLPSTTLLGADMDGSTAEICAWVGIGVFTTLVAVLSLALYRLGGDQEQHTLAAVDQGLLAAALRDQRETTHRHTGAGAPAKKITTSVLELQPRPTTTSSRGTSSGALKLGPAARYSRRQQLHHAHVAAAHAQRAVADAQRVKRRRRRAQRIHARKHKPGFYLQGGARKERRSLVPLASTTTRTEDVGNIPMVVDLQDVSLREANGRGREKKQHVAVDMRSSSPDANASTGGPEQVAVAVPPSTDAEGVAAAPAGSSTSANAAKLATVGGMKAGLGEGADVLDYAGEEAGEYTTRRKAIATTITRTRYNKDHRLLFRPPVLLPPPVAQLLHRSQWLHGRQPRPLLVWPAQNSERRRRHSVLLPNKSPS
ncbi:unnamed protein product [Amoebophrya sp. A120]|nr:unnamed protein product [Amoebophrya sp. A120]|eukprot:GSA120T00010952001.1